MKKEKKKTPSAVFLRNQQQKRIKVLEAQVALLESKVGKPLRRHLSNTRTAVTHKFDIAGHEGYLTAGLFEDGQPGELFITMAKDGSTIEGLMDTIGMLTGLALQYGIPLEVLVKNLAHQRFEPSGFTANPEIRCALSITDYVFRWMALQFVPEYRVKIATDGPVKLSPLPPGLDSRLKRESVLE